MAADLEQANVRVPAKGREAIVRLARYMREDPSFIARLNRFLDEEQDPAVGSLLSQRLDRLQSEVRELYRLLNIHPNQPQPEFPIGIPESEKDPEPGWTTGEGKGKRLTDAGLAELFSLIEQGLDDGKIAIRLGVKRYSVTSKRNSLGR